MSARLSKNQLCVIRGLFNYKSSFFQKELDKVNKQRLRKLKANTQLADDGWLPRKVIQYVGGYEGAEGNFPKPLRQLLTAKIIQRKGKTDKGVLYRITPSRAVLYKLIDELSSSETEHIIKLSDFEYSDYYNDMTKNFTKEEDLLRLKYRIKIIARRNAALEIIKKCNEELKR